jgi:hypothetical protein
MEDRLVIDSCPLISTCSPPSSLEEWYLLFFNLLVLTGANMVTVPGQKADESRFRTSWLSLKVILKGLLSILVCVSDSLLDDLCSYINVLLLLNATKLYAWIGCCKYTDASLGFIDIISLTKDTQKKSKLKIVKKNFLQQRAEKETKLYSPVSQTRRRVFCAVIDVDVGF